MSQQSGYHLARLKIVYCAKLRDHLEQTMLNLKESLTRELAQQPTAIQRLPRRAWRVWYLKAPFRNKLSKKHYVFHDWRYSFTFDDVNDPKAVVSIVLGSMTSETTCTVDYDWFYSGEAGISNSTALLLSNKQKWLEKNMFMLMERDGGWRNVYRYGNFKQYVPEEQR